MLISTPGTVAAVAAFNLGEASEPGGGGGSAWSSHESSHFGSQASNLGGFDVSSLRDSLLGVSAGDSSGNRGIDAAAGLTPVEQGELARQADEIVVTARSGPVTDADILEYNAREGIDTGAIERPHSYAPLHKISQVDASLEALRQQQAETGRKPSDELIEANLAGARADIEARAALADRMALDVVKSVVAPLDTAVAAYRVGVNGEYTLENELTLGGSLLGGVLGAGGKLMSGVGGTAVDQTGRMFSSGELMGVERASAELIGSVATKRSLTIAAPGSDDLRMLEYFGAEASVNTSASGIVNGSIVVRENASKAAVLEEFLHGTQARLGVAERLGQQGLGSAETHVKDFMIRHQTLLGLGDEDVAILQTLRDKGL